jgi:hypothetical protein
MVALYHALRRSRALALLLVVLTTAGTSGSWHLATDDPDCDLTSAHDHRAHNESFNTSKDATAPAHCAICHWLQAFRSGEVDRAGVPLAADVATTDLLLLSAAIRSADRIELPSRAPPQHSL